MSLALTLFTTPVIYIYLDRLSGYLSFLSSGKRISHYPGPAGWWPNSQT